MRRIKIRGNVPLESWPEVFRCFVNPAAHLQAKRLKLGIDFEVEVSDEQPLDVEAPVLKRMQEAAQQLGLDLEIELREGHAY
ncbi:MAG: hypothetical protein ACE5JP_02640 [Candidatus Bipolaricaulia bacterium]